MGTQEAIDQVLSMDAIKSVLVVVLAAMALLVAVSAGVKAWRHLFPHKEKEWQESAEKRLQKDFTRINAMDGRMDEIEEGQEQILLSVKALMHHEITGNSVDKLRARESELDEYLVMSRNNHGKKA